MPRLNLKHLRYFWAVAREGSVVGAAELLHVTPQTISGQLRLLEEQFGSALFQRAGRGLALTDTGRAVFGYADEMFRLGAELEQLLGGRHPAGDRTLAVGVAMVLPKLLVYRLLEPALRLPQRVRLVCREAPLVDLLADLSVHKLDLVLTDSPLSPALNIRAYSHQLGESGLSFAAAPALAAACRTDFPRSLDGAPFLMPTAQSSLRRALEQWFERESIRPEVVAEVDDRALMKIFGEAGSGVFTVPTAVEADVRDKYAVEVIGRTEAVKERYYAISAERRLKHPAVLAITDVARSLMPA
jgi:LysR family transcriptional activator of nhaA